MQSLLAQQLRGKTEEGGARLKVGPYPLQFKYINLIPAILPAAFDCSPTPAI